MHLLRSNRLVLFTVVCPAYYHASALFAVYDDIMFVRRFAPHCRHVIRPLDACRLYCGYGLSGLTDKPTCVHIREVLILEFHFYDRYRCGYTRRMA